MSDVRKKSLKFTDDFKAADSISILRCSDPYCDCVHVFLLDEKHRAFAEFVVPPEAVDKVVENLKSMAELVRPDHPPMKEMH
jgi:hypothetical protein